MIVFSDWTRLFVIVSKFSKRIWLWIFIYEKTYETV